MERTPTRVTSTVQVTDIISKLLAKQLLIELFWFL